MSSLTEDACWNDAKPGRLILRDDSGPRHFLANRPVNCGTQLRLRVDTGRGESWVWARYEACLSPGHVGVTLYTTFGRVIPDETTFLRWPTEAEQ